MDINIIFSFWLVSILFVLTPGADWAYTISAGIAGDKIIPAVSGLILGHLMASLIVVVGLGALLASHAMFIKLLTLFGALYIIWIAVSLYRFPPMPAAYNDGQEHTSDTPLKWMRKGFIISGLNPKVILLFLALLPQFVLPTLSFSITEQLLVLSIIHLVGCALVYWLIGVSARKILSNNPALSLKFGRASACILFILGSLMLVDSANTLSVTLT